MNLFGIMILPLMCKHSCLPEHRGSSCTCSTTCSCTFNMRIQAWLSPIPIRLSSPKTTSISMQLCKSTTQLMTYNASKMSSTSVQARLKSWFTHCHLRLGPAPLMPCPGAMQQSSGSIIATCLSAWETEPFPNVSTLSGSDGLTWMM